MARERSFVSGGACVCPLGCRSCDIYTLAWVSSWVLCPPLLHLWTRRRFGPDVDGCSGVDIVSWCCGVLCCVACVSVCSSCDVVVLSMLMSICINIPGGGVVANLPVSVGMVASGGLAATAGYVPTGLSVGLSV